MGAVPIPDDLLEILCCPSARTPLEHLDRELLEGLNAAIEGGRVRYADGSAVEETVAEALVTTDGRTIYRIDDSIPVMLVDRAIATDQLDRR